MNKLMHAWDQAGGDEAGKIEHSRSRALDRCYRRSSTGFELQVTTGTISVGKFWDIPQIHGSMDETARGQT